MKTREWLMERVVKLPGEDACWEWTGRRMKDGYGRPHITKTESVLAHRLSYELHIGPIPDGLCVLHRCDNPPCVRPSHLFLGTRADNAADMIHKGRRRPDSVQPRGAHHPAARLTDAHVREIRSLSANGWTYKRLGAKYGVHPMHIGLIVRRKRWAHVA